MLIPHRWSTDLKKAERLGVAIGDRLVRVDGYEANYGRTIAIFGGYPDYNIVIVYIVTMIIIIYYYCYYYCYDLLLLLFLLFII